MEVGFVGCRRPGFTESRVFVDVRPHALVCLYVYIYCIQYCPPRRHIVPPSGRLEFTPALSAAARVDAVRVNTSGKL